LPFGLIVCPPCRVWQVGGAKPSLDDVSIFIQDLSFVKKNFSESNIFIKIISGSYFLSFIVLRARLRPISKSSKTGRAIFSTHGKFIVGLVIFTPQPHLPGCP